MRRASVSIASNIAEGAYRGSIQDNIRFLYIAKWSCGELETQLVIAQEIWFLDIQDSEKLLAKTQIILKLLSGLISKKRLSNLPQ